MKLQPFILLLLFTTACITDEIPFKGAEERIVVEGWLTDQDTFQYVKLSKTQAFESTDGPEYVSNATVNVWSSQGERNSYQYTSEGWYRSQNEFAGRRGIMYWLAIDLEDGSRIESGNEVFRDRPTIDSLAYDSYTRDSESNPQVEETIYYPIVYSTDKPRVRNYYRWKLYRNDTLFSAPEYMILLDDRFFDGNDYQNEFSSFEYGLGDKVTLELHEISSAAFDYLSLLKSQTTTLGTVSSVSPASVRGNLGYIDKGDQVLGFWGVASVTTDTLTIR